MGWAIVIESDGVPMAKKYWFKLLTLQPGCRPAFPREYAGPLFRVVSGLPWLFRQKIMLDRCAMR